MIRWTLAKTRQQNMSLFSFWMDTVPLTLFPISLFLEGTGCYDKRNVCIQRDVGTQAHIDAS